MQRRSDHNNEPTETTNVCCCCLECIVRFGCCFVGFWFLLYFLSCSFFSSFSCCLILLIQSQSLSRRTTPFAPRVQVTGPISRAPSLFDCWLADFLFPYFGNGSFSALCHSLQFDFLVSPLWWESLSHLNPFTSFLLGYACWTNLHMLKRRSSIAWLDTSNWPCVKQLCICGNAGGCLPEPPQDKGPCVVFKGHEPSLVDSALSYSNCVISSSWWSFMLQWKDTEVTNISLSGESLSKLYLQNRKVNKALTVFLYSFNPSSLISLSLFSRFWLIRRSIITLCESVFSIQGAWRSTLLLWHCNSVLFYLQNIFLYGSDGRILSLCVEHAGVIFQI